MTEAFDNDLNDHLNTEADKEQRAEAKAKELIEDVDEFMEWMANEFPHTDGFKDVCKLLMGKGVHQVWATSRIEVMFETAMTHKAEEECND